MYRGVVGIVDLPYAFLMPTLNKQDFEHQGVFRCLLSEMGNHLKHYWEEAEAAFSKGVV